MKKEKEVTGTEKEDVQDVQEENKDALVAMKRKSITVFRKKSETEKYIKDGWVLV